MDVTMQHALCLMLNKAFFCLERATKKKNANNSYCINNVVLRLIEQSRSVMRRLRDKIWWDMTGDKKSLCYRTENLDEFH